MTTGKLALAGALVALANAAFAHSDVKDPNVKARMDDMTAIAGAVKTIGTMTKGEVAFDAAALDAALAEIETRAGEIPARFEVDVISPKSEARPGIWDDFDAFTTKAETLQTLAATRQGSVTSPDALPALMGDIGATCKSCHAEFKN